MSKKKKPQKQDNSQQDNPNKQLHHTMEHEEEYKDILISTSDKVIEWIEKNRKTVQIGIGIFLAVLIIGGASIYLAGSSNRADSQTYFKANKDLMDKVKDAQSTNLKGGKFTDDEINRLSDRYNELIDSSTIYGKLANFNQGVIYYSVGNYGEAALFFNKASKFNDFPIAFLSKLNLANNYFNLAYTDEKANQLDKAIENYNQAVSFYQDIETQFKDSPVLSIAHHSKGLSLEYLAQVYLKKDKKDLAKEKFTASKDSFNTLLKLAKDHVDVKQAFEDTSKIAIRRIDTELEKLN